MLKADNTAYSILAQDFDLLVDEPLKKYTSFKIGGPADLLALPKDKHELKNLLKKASDLDIPVTLFGGGTNLLITDKGIRGLVVITRLLKSKIRIIKTDLDGKTIGVEAGERLSNVCRFAINHSLSGLEFAAGIPGTIGGAIIMNAGTKSGEISNIVDSIEILNKKTLAFETIEKKELDFSYRRLNLTGIIVAATLTLKKESLEKIEKIFNHNLSQKNATQPVSFASAGCFFKNPVEGRPAGELIEKAGLKGVRINDAMVSQSHANFIVNIDNATCDDILLLKQHIQKSVFDKYHIKLKTEVRMEGE
ncbi:MAG: UDP-N-acetylmuramate dehydrogenase [Desulfobacterales bacterium]|nr:UDP-N-acetylmuramate dehydrogenase [Desulfobacterales bacterium]